MAKTLDEIVNALYKAADSSAPAIRNAFLSAIQELKTLTSLDDLEEAMIMQSFELVADSLHINNLNDLLFGIGMNNDAYVFTTSIQNSFIAGATAAITNLAVSNQKAIAFNPLNERAIQIMQNRGLQTVTDITQASRNGIKSALTTIIQDGTNPTKAAGQIRQLIGLTDSQAQAVLNFRRQLETQQRLGFTPPDERRLNAIDQSMIRRHMREGNFTTQNINDMVERYSQSLLNRRAMDIARTESMNAVNSGQNELWNQGRDLGILDDNLYRKFWITTPDDRLRPTHKAIPNMNPGGVKINAMFITPFGPVNSPGDYNSGLINCRCVAVLGEVGQSFTF